MILRLQPAQENLQRCWRAKCFRHDIMMFASDSIPVQTSRHIAPIEQYNKLLSRINNKCEATRILHLRVIKRNTIILR